MATVLAGSATGKRIGWPSAVTAAAVAGVVLAVLGACGSDPEGIQASGVVESDLIAVKAPTAGRIQAVDVDLGQDVSAGDVLLALDASLIDAQVDEARAGVDAARARLDQIRAGAPPEQRAVVDAQLALAMAQWDLARRTWEAAGASPSAGAPSAASAAQAATGSQPAGQVDPQAAYLQAEAAAQAAQAAADALRDGPSDAAVRVAEADLRQAEAALAVVQATRNRLDLSSPIDGRVMEILAGPGELTSAGATLLRVADPTTVTLTVHVPEADVADLKVGDGVDVTVAAYPDETFEGTIGAIAEQAEFTPRSVQTDEQRAMLVFAVRVDLENAKGRLKPGMPAEATFARR